MWIVFRLILALIGYSIRLSRGKRKRGPYEERDGRRYSVKIHRARGGIKGFTLGKPRRSPAWLKFHREGVVDRWAKRLGFAKEIQTGDARFDRLVYVTCDHPFIEKTLVERSKLRRAVSDILEQGYQRVEFDGASVLIKRKSSEEPTEEDFELLERVHAASKQLKEGMPSRFADPFFRKALVVEALIWSVLGYAIGGVVQLRLDQMFIHLSMRSVFWMGLGVAVVAFVGLVSAIGAFLRGSSRGHRIIVESFLVLLAGLPIAGIQFVSDTNRALDSSEPEIVSASVNRCEVRERRRKGRNYYSYHLKLADEQSTTILPEWIQVTKRLCDAVHGREGVRAEISIGRGSWGLRWYRRISVAGETWEPSS